MKMHSGITVVIPTHTERIHNGMLQRATSSVHAQTVPATAIAVAVDLERKGAAHTRQHALEMAQTQWVAFLDSDDEFLPNHLADLTDTAAQHEADYVYSYFVRAQGGDPLGHFGKPFNPAAPHHTTMTVLCRRELAMQAGFLPHDDMHHDWSGEDWRFTLRCVDLGAKIVHLPQETWIWHRHGGNTSGLVGKGDAR